MAKMTHSATKRHYLRQRRHKLAQHTDQIHTFPGEYRYGQRKKTVLSATKMVLPPPPPPQMEHGNKKSFGKSGSNSNKHIPNRPFVPGIVIIEKRGMTI
jgi:hypothetical protein